jgi:aryl-alcohol dehydrogenase-like predicted oxidoreductase
MPEPVMKRIPLGRTGLTVSELCLGTMTWGTQNSEAEGHAQMDMAMDHGVDFWDTAEMYPVNPVSAPTVGRTEEIIGTWFAARGLRGRVVLATKVTGPGMDAVRDGGPLTGAVLRRAVEGSLQRLQTDHIDLYQLHWPSRSHYHFRQIWRFDPSGQDGTKIDAQMLELLEVSAQLIAEGKIGHLALSNETVWGAGRWLALASAHGLPRMMTVQNEYSLLCRQFDTDWAEFSVMEDMPLLGFSPLATGLLTGKYVGNAIPPSSRRAKNPDLSGRVTPRAFAAVEAYLAIAARHGLNPAQMAIAWSRMRPFVNIPIIGATSLDQLSVNIGAADLVLTRDVLDEIAMAHQAHPQPY